MLDCIVNRFVAALIYLSVIPSLASAADNLGVLGSKPKWSVLENYQDTITHDEFARLINDVYCTHGFAADLIKIDSDAAQILTNRESRNTFTLSFASDPNSKARIPRLWRPAKSLPPAKPEKPLAATADIYAGDLRDLLERLVLKAEIDLQGEIRTDYFHESRFGMLSTGPRLDAIMDDDAGRRRRVNRSDRLAEGRRRRDPCVRGAQPFVHGVAVSAPARLLAEPVVAGLRPAHHA